MELGLTPAAEVKLAELSGVYSLHLSWRSHDKALQLLFSLLLLLVLVCQCRCASLYGPRNHVSTFVGLCFGIDATLAFVSSSHLEPMA